MVKTIDTRCATEIFELFMVKKEQMEFYNKDWYIHRESRTIKESTMFPNYIESALWAIVIFIHALVSHEWKTNTERTDAAENYTRP